MLFSKKADFTFEVFILKFRVIVAAEKRVIERVVVQIWQRGFVSGVWTQSVSRLIGRFRRQSGRAGVQALLLRSTD